MHAPVAMTRSWPMLAALGGGLVATAVAAGAGGAPRVVLVGLGVAALGWGVLSLRAGRPLAPRSVIATSVAFLLLAGMAVASGSMTDVAGLPLAAACAFVAVVALSLAHTVRGRRVAGRQPEASAGARPSPAAEARRSFLGLVIGAVLVSALATPALAATEAGRSAVPHGEHGTQTDVDSSDPGHHH